MLKIAVKNTYKNTLNTTPYNNKNIAKAKYTNKMLDYRGINSDANN